MLRKAKKQLMNGIILTIIVIMVIFMFQNSSTTAKGKAQKNTKLKYKKEDFAKKDKKGDFAKKNNYVQDNNKEKQTGNKKYDDKTDSENELEAAFKKLDDIKKRILRDDDDDKTYDEDDFDAAFQKLNELRKGIKDNADVIEDYDAGEVDYVIHAADKYQSEEDEDLERGGHSDSYEEDDGEAGEEEEEEGQNGVEDVHDEGAAEHGDPDGDEEEDDDGYGNADDNDLEEEEDDDEEEEEDEDYHFRGPTDRDLLSFDDGYDGEDGGEEYTYYADSEDTVTDAYNEFNDDNDYEDDKEENEIEDDDGVNIDTNDAPGEMGTGVYIKVSKLEAEDLLKYRALYRQHGFNGYASDMISVNRSLQDVRNNGCKQLTYDTNPGTSNLPSASVIICFHNEALSVLLRTVMSVLNRSPISLLEEIVLVDDNSTLGELSTLNRTLTPFPKVKLVRTERHEGLIRARLLGVQHSKAPVLVFLDSHVECFTGWLEPLLERLTKKRNGVVCPQIHTISDKSFKIMQNDQVYVANLILSDLSFDWLPVQARDRLMSPLETDTVRSPTFAGGLFAIYRKYFEEIGSYDDQMDLWGGENLEMSFRIWMCGGSVEVHPCSNVAHVFRETNPLQREMDLALTRAKFKNNLRMAEVWLDDHIKYYKEYERMGVQVTIGDTSQRRLLKESLRCESFQWYIENVYPGIYIPGQAIKFGQILNKQTRKCLTSLVDVVGSRLGVAECDDYFFQYWQFSKLNALQRETGCAAYNSHLTSHKPTLIPTIEKCNGGGESQYWIYTEKHWLFHPETDTCMASTREGLVMLPCKDDTSFIWTWFEMEEPRNPFLQ